MPPRHKYSKGCGACRRIKVKCDEERPQCRRCVKAGRTCPGFPELSNFLSMNDDFATRKPTPKQKSTDKSHASGRNMTQPLHQRRDIVKSTPQFWRPSTDWDQTAVTYFFRNFVATLAGEPFGYLQFLPELYSTHSDVECLSVSLQAVSLASLANISNVPSLQTRARQVYGKALVSIRAALKRLSPTDHFSLLIAIFLLNKYETLNGSKESPSPHEKGLAKLISYDGHPLPQTAVETSVHQMIHARLHLSFLEAESGAWDAVQAEGLDDVPNLVPTVPFFDLWSLIRGVGLSHRAIRALSTGRETRPLNFSAQLLNALNTATLVEAQLTAWHTTMTGQDIFGTVTLEEPISNYHYAPKLHFFAFIQHGAKWMGFWGSQIMVLRSISFAMDMADEAGLDCEGRVGGLLTRESIHERIMEAVDRICSSVAYMLGEIDSHGKPLTAKGPALGPFFLVRSLEEVLALDEITAHQHQFVSNTLLKIAHVWGVGVALTTRDEALRKSVDGSSSRSQSSDCTS